MNRAVIKKNKILKRKKKKTNWESNSKTKKVAQYEIRDTKKR